MKKIHHLINTIWNVCDLSQSLFAFFDNLAIYVNLIIEVKLFLNVVKNDEKNMQNARIRLLNFYDDIFFHKNFKQIDKSDFKQLRKRYRNQHDFSNSKKSKILKECFTFIDLFSSKAFSEKRRLSTFFEKTASAKDTKNESKLNNDFSEWKKLIFLTIRVCELFNLREWFMINIFSEICLQLFNNFQIL